MAVLVSKIERKHNRKSFDCGNDSLNTHIRVNARQHTDREIARTDVLTETVDPTQIRAFRTLSYIQVAPPPGSKAGNYPYPLSGLLLARLATDIRFQGRGYAEHLVIDTLKQATVANQVAPLVGVFVDSKTSETDRYYKRFGFRPIGALTSESDDQPGRLWLPIGTCLTLA